jgi:ubiquinone/menaquinone biosynthesis C-methylase UbiE
MISCGKDILRQMRDIHQFSGRSDHTQTEFISRKILMELGIGPHDRLVDIGCGDGTLLQSALLAGVTTAIGFSGTEEEAERLRALGLNVSQGWTDALPLPDRSASAVVCHSVLHIVPPEKIPASLREIARIAEPEARIWIGELPRFREPASIRSFETVPEMLWWLLRKRGLRTFLGMCRRLLNGTQQGPVLRTAQAFWAEPEQFVRMAAEARLKVERHFPNQTLDSQQQLSASATRHDYLLRRE